MMYESWPYLTRGRGIVLLLAVIGVGFLLMQTRQSPVQISAWNGGPFAAKPIAQGAPPAIVAQAAPQTGRGDMLSNPDVPAIDPLGEVHTIMTQGYGVGSHAPANVWGAIDLAIDGNGDGQADPQGTMGAPIYATHDGVVHLARDTYPAGNHIWLEGQHFKTGYSHLKDFAVADGQAVKRGDLIGFVGSTGEASGPHLDYQVWKDDVNVNPLDYGAFAGAK